MLKKEVLRNKKDFNKIYNKGKSIGDRFVVLFYLKNGLNYNRISVLASKKVGNAVIRNRARRLIKESLRKIKPFNFEGYDLIFVARKSIENTKQYDVQKSVERTIKKIILR